MDFHDVETRGDGLRRVQNSQPIIQPVAQKPAFGGINSSHGCTAAGAGAAFYFYGYQGVCISAHEVELAAFPPFKIVPQHL